MGCTPSILSSSDSNQNRKDSGLFCSNLGESASRNLNDTENILNGNNDLLQPNVSICNQILVNSYSKGDVYTNSGKNNGNSSGKNDNSKCNEDTSEQYGESFQRDYSKKDSIVSVTGPGHLGGYSTVQTVIRRNTGSGASNISGRLGHRKSSLALTPEEEPLETATQVSILKNTKLLRT